MTVVVPVVKQHSPPNERRLCCARQRTSAHLSCSLAAHAAIALGVGGKVTPYLRNLNYHKKSRESRLDRAQSDRRGGRPPLRGFRRAVVLPNRHYCRLNHGTWAGGVAGAGAGVRKYLGGQLNSPMVKGLNKGLMSELVMNKKCIGGVRHPGRQTCDWSVMRIYPRFRRLIGPSREYTRCGRCWRGGRTRRWRRRRARHPWHWQCGRANQASPWTNLTESSCRTPSRYNGSARTASLC